LSVHWSIGPSIFPSVYPNFEYMKIKEGGKGGGGEGRGG